MNKSTKRQTKASVGKVARPNKIVVTFTDQELDAIDAYCKKYKAQSRTAVVREAAMRFVMGRFMEDYPTLFEKNDLDKLIVF